jgi:hypothetical protein
MSTVRIQVRRGTASEWTAANPILAAGEMGVETNTNLFKFGNGSSTWTALSYANSSDVAISEISQDAINAALTMGSGLSKTYDDGANTITITVDTGVISTKAFATSEATAKAAAAQTAAATDATSKANAARTAAIATAESYTDSAVSGVNNSLADYIPTSDRGVAGGVAALDTNGKVPEAQLKLTGLTTGISTSGVISASDLTISGNLVVNGTTTTLNTQNFSVKDTLLYIAEDNHSDQLDLGFVAGMSDGVYGHTGLVRDASDGKWKLFKGVTDEPTTTINFSQGTLDDLAIRGLTANAINTTNATITGTLVIPASSITESNLQNSSVSTTKIADNSVSADKLQANSVTAPKIVDSSITAAKMADQSISTAKIADAAVTVTKIGDLAVTTQKIQDSAISTAKIGTGSVTADKLDLNSVTTVKVLDSAITENKIATSAVTTAKIADNSITSAKIVDGTIVNADINASAAIDQAKIAGLGTALAALAPTASPTFTGTVTLPTTTSIGTVTSTQLGYVSGVTSAIQTQIDTKATTSVVTAHTGATTNVHGIADTAALATKSYVDTADALKAPLASPTFTGTVAGITKSMVGLGNVDNTTDAAKPVSTATQTALDLKAPIASPTFTGTVTIPAGASISGFAPLASPALTGVPTAPTAAAGTSTTQVATTAFVGTAVSNLVASAPAALDTLNELATALGNDAAFSTTVTNAIGLKAPIASPTFTGTVTIPAGASIAGYATSANPTFTGTNTVANITVSGTANLSANGVQLSDGTQTKVGVPSLTTIGTSIGAAYNLSTGGLALRDQLIPISGAFTVTVPTNATTAYPIGTSVSFYQSAGTDAVFAGASGVTLLATPGSKLRALYSSATLTKVATDTWLLAGDLKA